MRTSKLTNCIDSHRASFVESMPMARTKYRNFHRVRILLISVAAHEARDRCTVASSLRLKWCRFRYCTHADPIIFGASQIFQWSTWVLSSATSCWRCSQPVRSNHWLIWNLAYPRKETMQPPPYHVSSSLSMTHVVNSATLYYWCVVGGGNPCIWQKRGRQEHGKL